MNAAATNPVDLSGSLAHTHRMGPRPLSFVGRDAELKELRHALGGVTRGRGGLWLICGEPGIGKSRLAEEIAEEALALDISVAWGRSQEVGGAPGYWPWIQVLRPLLRDETNVVEHRLPFLAQVYPELRHRFPHALAAPLLPPESARFALLDAVASTVIDCALRQPMLVVLDDLHAADPSTLLLLDFIAGQSRNAPLLLLGTYREVEARRTDSGEVFSRLARQARTLPLTRLTRAQCGTYLQDCLGRGLGPMDVETVFARSEGNPLYLVELSRMLSRDPDAPIAPDALQISSEATSPIRERLAILDPATRELLAESSVAGRELQASLLVTVLRRQPADLHRAFEEAIRAAVIQPLGDGAFRFSHILIRNELYAELDELQRHDLHARFAAFEEPGADQDLSSWARIAHHYALAGPLHSTQAARAARKRAELALAALAYEEAIGAYGDALRAAGTDQSLRAGLLLGLARAHLALGDRDTGARLCQEAAALARDLHDSALLASVALTRGSQLIFASRDSELIALLEEAIAGLPAEDRDLRAQLMARWAAAIQPAEDPKVGIDAAVRAIEMAREGTSSWSLLAALRDGGSAMVDLAPPSARIRHDRELVALAARMGQVTEELLGLSRVFMSAFELGHVAEAEAAGERYAQRAADVGHRTFLWRAAAMRVTRNMWQADLTSAERGWAEASRLAEGCGDANARPTLSWQRAHLSFLQGDLPRFLADLAELRRQFSSSPIMLNALALVEASSLSQIQQDEMSREVSGELIDLALSMGDQTVLELIADIAYAKRDQHLARRLEKRFRDASELTSDGVIGLVWRGSRYRSLGLARRAMGDLDGAADELRTAIAMVQRHGGNAARISMLAQLASIERDRENLELSRELAAEAGEEARRCGMKFIDAWCREHLAATADAEGGQKQASPKRAAAEASEEPVPAQGIAELRIDLDGEVWLVSHSQNQFRLRDTKGLRFVAKLLTSPRTEFHVLDLVSDSADAIIDLGDSGEGLDGQARDAYRERLSTLQQEIEEAEAWHDQGRAALLREELEFLSRELSRSYGLGGRERRTGGAAERARVNVQRRIKDAVVRIRREDELLGRHLERSLRTGLFCAYDPE